MWRGRYNRNQQLFVLIASVTPLTIGAQELIAHFKNRWQDEQRQTEQYEWNELSEMSESEMSETSSDIEMRERGFWGPSPEKVPQL